MIDIPMFINYEIKFVYDIFGNDSALKIVCSYVHVWSHLKLVCGKQNFAYKIKDPIHHQENFSKIKCTYFIRISFCLPMNIKSYLWRKAHV